MRAVQRMKGFGMTELSFDAYAIARERVPRLKDNAWAALHRINRGVVDAEALGAEDLWAQLVAKDF